MAVEKIGYSVEETVVASSVGRSLIYEEIRAGKLRATKIGRRTVILADDLKAWLQARASGEAT
ncbi:excisionase family DNA binding protein [Azospirillum brasilense]|uniref:Excisionase family DNA binding protein n=1 Tax=Azospirillum brasilense TaxID=192 RepID=A0A560BM89_AZOBR|nr:helix-turn-helix domain-containing protein [Azospirillum brasilense]TWA73734.1 excisionase family DNA binding protein [Azospirillum brasilense]